MTCTTSTFVYLHGYICVETQLDNGKLCWYGWIGLVRSSCNTCSYVIPDVLFLFFIQVAVAVCCKVIFFLSSGCLIMDAESIIVFFLQFWHLAFWWQSLFHRIFIILFLVPFGAMRTDLPTATGAFMELWSVYLVEFSGLGSDQVSNNPHMHTAHSHQTAGEGAFAWVQLYVPAPYHLCWWACCEYTCVFSLVIDGLMLLCCRW